MKRALFNLFALASAILCAALLSSWQRSPWGMNAESQWRVHSGVGSVWFLGSWGGSLRVIRQRVDDGGGAAGGQAPRPNTWDVGTFGWTTRR